MSVIDAHTHIFPDDTAAKILEFTSRKFKVKVYGKGTAEDLLSQMDANRVSHAVIHMVAINPGSVKYFNTWLIRLNEPRFIKFGTLHPSYKDYQSEISRLHDHGIIGIKLQPEVQEFRVDDATLTYPLYEELAKKGMMVMFHVGGNPLPSANLRSTPEMIRKVANDFPELKIIAAHLGGLNLWDQVYEKLAGTENVYLETSMTYSRIAPSLAEKIIRKHGSPKTFFGTDYPFAPIRACINQARSVPFLTAREKEEILFLNALRFFHIADVAN